MYTPVEIGKSARSYNVLQLIIGNGISVCKIARYLIIEDVPPLCNPPKYTVSGSLYTFSREIVNFSVNTDYRAQTRVDRYLY